MVQKVQIKRTSTPNSPPVTLDPGELAVEMADPTRLWAGVPTGLDPAGKKLLFDSSSSGFGDAPADGTTYGRNNSLWKREDRGTNRPGLLKFVSTTALRFDPHNGNSVKINGIWHEIPATGVTISNVGLVAAALSYIYLFHNGTTLVAELSATGHSTSQTPSNVGTEIKAGDDTRSLIGMAYGHTGGVFNDGVSRRYVRSWFNRQAQNNAFWNNLTGFQGSTTAGTPWTEYTASIRAYFLVWADEMVTAHCTFMCYANIYGTLVFGGVMFDNPVNFDANHACGNAEPGGAWQGVAISTSNVGFSEGYHWASIAIWSGGGAYLVVGRTTPGPYPTICGRVG